MSAQRRPRRTKAAIENCINTAAESLIAEKGFTSTLLTDITKRAGIEPAVFYNRYKNIDEFYDELVRRYDYWLSDVVKKQAEPEQEPSEDNCAAIFDGLFSALCEDKIMQEVLRWEVSEGNPTTQRTAIFREMQNMQLVFKYKKLFRDGNSPIDIASFSALLIGGIYYLFLHKNRSTFCGVDLNDPADLEEMRRTIRSLVSLVFATLPPSLK